MRFYGNIAGQKRVASPEREKLASRIIYPARVLFRIERGDQFFSKQKLTGCQWLFLFSI